MRRRVWILCFFFILIAAGCSGKQGISLSTGGDYGVNVFEFSLYENGALIQDEEMVWVFDAATEQMVPFCTRAECSHTEEDCPARYLRKRAGALFVYEGKIWYLREAGEKLEVWTADLNGENHTLKGRADFEEAANIGGFKRILYQNKIYAVKTTVTADRETFDMKQSLISISLEDGTIEELAQQEEAAKDFQLVGVYEEEVYYTQVIEEENGELVRNIYCLNQESKETEVVAQGGFYDMDGKWLAYIKTEDGKSFVEVREAGTGETFRAFDMPEEELGILQVSGGNILWTKAPGGTEELYSYLYQIEEQKLSRCFYDFKYHSWNYVGDGWLCAGKGEVGKEYYYVSTEDFLAGKEVEKVTWKKE